MFKPLPSSNFINDKRELSDFLWQAISFFERWFCLHLLLSEQIELNSTANVLN